MSVFLRTVAVAAVASLGFVGGTMAKAEGEKLVYIYHSGDEDFWWNTALLRNSRLMRDFPFPC